MNSLGIVKSLKKKIKTSTDNVVEIIRDKYSEHKYDLLDYTDKLRVPIDFIIQIPKKMEEMLSFENASFINIKRSIQLDDFTCGAQSAFSILDYYDIPITRKKLNDVLNIRRNGYASETAIYRLFRDMGLKLKKREKANYSTIVEAIDHFEAPFLTTITLDDPYDHWVIVYGYSKKHFFVIDPSLKRPFVKWNKSKFRSVWDKSGIIVLSP